MFNRYPTARYCWYFRQWMRNDFLIFFLLVLGFAIAALYKFFTCTIYQPHTIAELLETFALIMVFFLLAYGTYCVGLRRWVASFKRPEYMSFMMTVSLVISRRRTVKRKGIYPGRR